LARRGGAEALVLEAVVLWARGSSIHPDHRSGHYHPSQQAGREQSLVSAAADSPDLAPMATQPPDL